MRGGWVERGTVLIRLSRPHFAFYRGYLDGLHIGELATRYLETASGLEEAAGDLRAANSAVKWIGDQLRVAAWRASMPAAERLLKIAPEKLHVVYGEHVPTLEQFREMRDPYEMYSEQDIIGLFQEQFGSRSSRASRLAERNNRLRTRQLSALWQLEELVGADPNLSDGVDGWLDPAISVRLKTVNIDTLQQLVDAINGFGFRWYTKVPKIGVKAAAQIVRWLTEPSVSDALGVKLHARGLVPRQRLRGEVAPVYAPRTDIVPLEYFKMPQALDGLTGTNRGVRSLLSAHNDLAAIEAWLSRYQKDSHTRRSYRKEAERFVLWAIIEKGRAVSSLTVEDCIDYRDFL